MKSIVASLGMLAVAGFSWVGWSQLRQPASESLTKTATAALVEQGIDGVNVSFTNLDGLVSGATTPELQEQVRETIMKAIPTGRLTFAETDADSIGIDASSDKLNTPNDNASDDAESIATNDQEQTSDIAPEEGAGDDAGIEMLSLDDAGLITDTPDSGSQDWGTDADVNSEADLASALSPGETIDPTTTTELTDDTDLGWDSSAGGEDVTEAGLDPEVESNAPAETQLAQIDTPPANKTIEPNDDWGSSLSLDEGGWSENLGSAANGSAEAGIVEVPPAPGQNTASSIDTGDSWNSGSEWGNSNGDLASTAADNIQDSSDAAGTAVTGLSDEDNIMSTEGSSIAEASPIEVNATEIVNAATQIVDGAATSTADSVASNAVQSGAQTASTPIEPSDIAIREIDEIDTQTANIANVATDSSTAATTGSDSIEDALAVLDTDKPDTSAASSNTDADSFTEKPRFGVYMANRANDIAVREIVAGSPAEAAGLRVGDLIYQLGDRTIHNFDDLKAAVLAKQPRDVVEVRFRRGGQPRRVNVKLGVARVPLPSKIISPKQSHR